MRHIEKLLEGIKPVLPDITEEFVKQMFGGECAGCPIIDYCNGEFVRDEFGDPIPNPSMDCNSIVDKWLNEEYEETKEAADQ